MEKYVKVIDVSSLGPMPKIEVKINNKLTDLQIGDKLHFPIECSYLKTVVAMQIFEDKSVNYTLKWFDGTTFNREVVSLNDLKLLNYNVQPKAQVGLNEKSN